MNKVKFKPHKGLRKRVRITRNGKVKVSRAGGRHRKSLHTSSQNRQLRRSKIACTADNIKVALMLGIKPRRRRPSATTAVTADTPAAQEQSSTD